MNYVLYQELHLALRSMVRSKFLARVLQVVACRYDNKGNIEVFI